LNFLLGADAYVSCGRLAAETLRRAALWNPIVYYLPFMVDFEVFDYRKSGFPLRRRLFIPENVFVLSMVARIQEWKGQDVFVEAAMRILKEAPDTYFLIFGEPTFDRDRVFFDYLRNKVEASGLKKQIILAGYMAESVYAYAASDVICHCSKTPEPFGMVIIEAFAMKKPVIATACGGPLESVEDGKNGYLVSPANVEELVSAMKRCLKEKSRMAEMGEHGYRKAMEVYSPEKFAAKINSFISEYTRN
jgi:glycosyltransferase involved in cell wall biosynthesis